MAKSASAVLYRVRDGVELMITSRLWSLIRLLVMLMAGSLAFGH
jgi:hypothetical protein